jgi:hypothetical protein
LTMLQPRVSNDKLSKRLFSCIEPGLQKFLQKYSQKSNEEYIKATTAVKDICELIESRKTQWFDNL